MTTIISILGILGRALGRVLTSSLGWATSLLYGRVPKDHQVYVEAMFGASVLWAALVVLTLIPAVLGFVLSTTPFAPSLGLALLRALILGGLVLLPLVVGDREPARPGERPATAGARDRRRPAAGLPAHDPAGGDRRVPAAGRDRPPDRQRPPRLGGHPHPDRGQARRLRRRCVDQVEAVLRRRDIRLERHTAPFLLEIPGRVLALIAGRDVADVLPDRMIELRGSELEVGVYPSDIVVSGKPAERLLARAAIMTSLAQAAAHFTTSAESQRVEDRIEVIARPSTPTLDALAEVEAIDGELARLDVPSDDWDILFRLRLQAERDVLRRA